MSTATNTFSFEPASKAQAKARIALAGPSGSGKTYTALTIATTFGGPIAVIDTERGSASKYAGIFKFSRLNMTHYDPRDLPRALAAAAAAQYPVVIIDSLSKFWGGEGGMLQQVDNAAKRGYGGNSFGGWKEARPMETAMIEAILGYPGHVIVTMRTKTAYEILEDDRGRKVPTKIGLKPEQRDGIEYEFDIVGDMDLENTLTVSKSRCPALSGEVIRRPGEAFAQSVMDWLTDGEPVLSAADYRDQAIVPSATYDGLRQLYMTVKAAGLLGAAVNDAAGEPMTLGQLVIARGKEAEAREVFGATAGGNERALREHAPAGDSVQPPAGPQPRQAPPEPAAHGTSDPWADQPEVFDPMDGEAPPAPAAKGDDQEWIAGWRKCVADARTRDVFAQLTRQITEQIKVKKVSPATAGTLAKELRERRNHMESTGQLIGAESAGAAA